MGGRERGRHRSKSATRGNGRHRSTRHKRKHSRSASSSNEVSLPMPIPPDDTADVAAAKKQANQQLVCISKIECKEERLKEFRHLQRQWHPDKNPSSLDIAT